MTDQRTMAELLHAPTEGFAEAIVVPSILTEHFELKHSLINMMTSDQFFRLEKDNPHDHIRWFNKITSTIKYKDVPNLAIKLMLFPFSLAGEARHWLEKEPPHSILTWEDLVSKFINEFFPPLRTTYLRNEISNFQQCFDETFHEAWDRYKDLLRACPHHGFTELHQLDTFYNALNLTDQDSLNSAAGGNLLERSTQDVLTIIKNKSMILNQQTSNVTTAMTAILKQFQATPPPASVKAIEEICVTYGGAHPYYQCLAADGNTFPKFQDNIQGYISAVAVNYNQEEDELIEETLTDLEHTEYTIKVPHPLVQKAKPPSLRNYVVHQRDLRHPHILYPSRINQKKQLEKDEIQIHKFWQMFKQLHINITLADALILIPKYQKMLKALLSNKEKLLELANTPLNENCSTVILKKLPEKLREPGKFLIPYGFSELKCKALAYLAGGKLYDRNVEESYALLEDFALYDNESWNDPRDFTKPVKAIALPQDVPSTSNYHLIELENQVQHLMEAHLAPTQPTQVNKVTTLCEICSVIHDTQYCMEDLEQDFVEYASSRTNKAKVLKAITDRIAGALPSDTVKNLKLSTSPILSAHSYPTIDPQCSSNPSTSINTIKVHSKEANIS
nr:reverse transcriptase domain-containing protein [Tanacetum cinerariifolium]